MTWWMSLLSDDVMFWLIQGIIFTLFVISIFGHTCEKILKKKKESSLSVVRGDQSMRIFYGSYAGLNGLLVAICLSVEPAKGYRALWVMLDTVIPAYICLFNPWSRNKILGWVHYLKKLEE